MILTGKIVHGKEKGRKIGFPTANLQPEASFVLPKEGVYTSKIKILPESIISDSINISEYIGITNVGLRPTADNENSITIETHILDFCEDIYGKYIQLEICGLIRPITKFNSMEELGEQLQKDCVFAKNYFSESQTLK